VLFVINLCVGIIVSQFKSLDYNKNEKPVGQAHEFRGVKDTF
jgi:hypothetical protein